MFYNTVWSKLKFVSVVQADPAQALNVPVVPLGVLLAAAYPLSSRPPYVLSWLNDQISAQDMMHPELFAKLVLNNFCKCSLALPFPHYMCLLFIVSCKHVGVTCIFIGYLL